MTFTRVTFWIRIVLLAQLAVGTVVVTVTAQRRPIEEVVAVQGQALNDRATALEDRIKKLEELKIGERLAVLDGLAEDGHEIKLLSYGTVFTLVGTLALALFERRNRRTDQ